MRLIPIRALDGNDVEWLKIAESKGCGTICTGVMKKGSYKSYTVCVAMKRQVMMSKIILFVVTTSKRMTDYYIYNQLVKKP